IAHVLRCFADGDVTHVEGTVDPLRDREIVETELMLADLESLERRENAAQKKARGGDAEAKAQLAVMEPMLALLRDGKPARNFKPTPEQVAIVQQLQLITTKAVLYVCNVAEADAAAGNELTRTVAAMAKAEGSASVVVSAAIEAEVALLEHESERQEFLASLGLSETGLARVIRAG